MKISRHKKAQKYMSFYVNNFGFRQPFQILIDATFCFAAVKNHCNVTEQLTKYYQTELKLLTTPCIILESEKLGQKLSTATFVVKKFALHKCGHEKNPLSGSECMKKMVVKNRYIVATQDRDLQEWIRRKPGIPLMYLHNLTPVLEQPSDISKNNADRILEEKVCVNKYEEKKLAVFKKKEGLTIEEPVNRNLNRIKKKKNPNPLSMKKKKPKTVDSKLSVKDKGVEKKRKRVKISKHVKEQLKK